MEKDLLEYSPSLCIIDTKNDWKCVMSGISETSWGWGNILFPEKLKHRQMIFSTRQDIGHFLETWGRNICVLLLGCLPLQCWVL